MSNEHAVSKELNNCQSEIILKWNGSSSEKRRFEKKNEDHACVSSTNLKYLSLAQQLNPSVCLIKSDSFDKMPFYAIREYIQSVSQFYFFSSEQ